MDKHRLIKIIQEEIEDAIKERELTNAEKKKKEDIVKALKDKAKDLKAKYGDDWKSVMYAIATKKAKESE